MRYIFPQTAAVICGLVLLSACTPETGPETTKPTSLPPLIDALTCLRGTGPLIAAHRGRDKFTNRPENSIDSLSRLKKSGFVIAEVDVARLKDGTHILHHDGVWEETTTGKGVVASTDWATAQTFLLKRRNGRPVSERLPTLDQALSWAAGDFYFELDIKSSANPATVITALKNTSMEDHVVLIAYSKKQASDLARLSKQITGRKMLISSPGQNTDLHWMGTRNYSAQTAAHFSKSGKFSAFGMMSPKYAKRADYSALSILVSDYPPEAKIKAKTRGKDRARIEACEI